MAALLEHGCTTVFREAPLLHPTDSLATIWTSKNPGRRSKDQIDLAACLIMLYATGLDCVIMFLGLLSDWLMVLVISLAGCCFSCWFLCSMLADTCCMLLNNATDSGFVVLVGQPAPIHS